MLDRIFGFLCSLKLAVVLLASLAISLATGTILESLYDTPTAQYLVYRSAWFHGILALLGVNIFCVMVDRWPWKKRHAPFLLAHIGILLLLFGSWVTEHYGIDGSMRIAEGETSSAVDLEGTVLVLTEKSDVRSVPIPWVPPQSAFRPVSAPYGVTVDRMISHAEPEYSFNPQPGARAATDSKPALHLKLSGGPMNISQDFWLWSGDPSWSVVQAGPAFLSLSPVPAEAQAGRPTLSFMPRPDGGVDYRAVSSEGKAVEGKISRDKLEGGAIHPGWRGDVTITLLKWIPNASVSINYKPSRVQYGEMAPPAAIHIVAGKGSEGSDSWLGIGDRVLLTLDKREVEVGYYHRRVILPFALKLDRFTIDRYEGSRDPASYASQVDVLGARDQAGAPRSVRISMNEPLEQSGFTVYQSSYEDAQPRPVVSIFSINRDPGRPWKNTGSLLIVLGTIVLFSGKYWTAKFRKARENKAAEEAAEAAGTPRGSSVMEGAFKA